MRYIDGSTQTLHNPEDPEWSEDSRFATIKHDHGQVIVNHEEFGSFEIMTLQPSAQSRVAFGGW